MWWYVGKSGVCGGNGKPGYVTVVKYYMHYQHPVLGGEGVCNHLLGQVCSCAVAGTVVFRGDADTESSRHLPACVNKPVGQYQVSQ